MPLDMGSSLPENGGTDMDDPQERIEQLEAHIKQLQLEISRKDDVLHQKNLALDALGFVWCSGGCNSGVLRYTQPPLNPDTKLNAEQVSIVERNTVRLRYWFEGRQCRISQTTGKVRDRCAECSSIEECARLRKENAKKKLSESGAGPEPVKIEENP